MNNRLIDEVASALRGSLNPGATIIHTGGETSLSREGFIEVHLGEHTGKVSFIDGGNSPILVTPSQNCQAVRVACVTFDGRRRTHTDRKTALVLAQTMGERFEIRWFGLDGDAPLTTLRLDDPHLRQGTNLVNAAQAIELCRSLVERTTALAAIDGHSAGGIIVVDGDLTARHPVLIKARNELFQTCEAKGVTLIGIAKTTTAATENGWAATHALSLISPPGMWAYTLNCEDGIYRAFARLHPTGRHCFLVESSSPLNASIFSRLAAISNDLAFPGYPYGLIVADQLARVPNQERDMLSLSLQLKAATKNPGLLSALSGSNAHGILDRMSY